MHQDSGEKEVGKSVRSKSSRYSMLPIVTYIISSVTSGMYNHRRFYIPVFETTDLSDAAMTAGCEH